MRNRASERGGSIIEFALISMTLFPLLLGTGALGVNMIRVQQTTQLAREAGEMFARGVDFSKPGNLSVLVQIGSSLGLSATQGSGTAVVILTALTYVDKQACALAGAVDTNGNPANCTNFGQWVFAQRQVVGNPSIRTSNTGSPLTTGPTGVSMDPVSGKIAVNDYVSQAGAVARFSSINPYSSVNGVVSGLPAGQYIYLAEAATSTLSMSVYGGTATYAFAMF